MQTRARKRHTQKEKTMASGAREKEKPYAESNGTFYSAEKEPQANCCIPALAITGIQNMLGGVPQHRDKMTRGARHNK